MVSFIIVHYKTLAFTQKAINSILKYHQNSDYEIILIDNASCDGSLEKLKSIYNNHIVEKKVLIIESSYNGGFSYGNNLGFNKAKGDFLYYLILMLKFYLMYP